jgi:hypothetical protein
MAHRSGQFSLEHGSWTTTAILPSWIGIQSRHDLYGSCEQVLPFDGAVEIVFVREGGGREPLTPAEIASVEWLIENEAAISENLFKSLAKDYPDQQEFYAYRGEARAELMPDIESSADLRLLTRLSAIYVHSVLRDGIPYIGFGFNCTWEQEHALGILMHGTQAVQIGWAETAFVPGIARKTRDLEATDGESSAPEISSWRSTVRKKKQAKKNLSEALQRSATLAAIGKEIDGEPLLDEGFYREAGERFCIVGPQISEDAINAIFPDPFPGKEDFVQFYLLFNGGSRTEHGCIMHCGNPDHRVSRNQIDKLNLEGFHSISPDPEERLIPFSNMLNHHTTLARIYAEVPEMNAFLNEHIGFAFDHTGNDLCLSRKSGRIFFMDWRAYKEGPVEVASSFREFVLKFWNAPYSSLH